STTILSGTNSTTVYFRDNTAQSTTLQPSIAGLTAVNLPVTVSPGPATQLALTGSTSVTAASCAPYIVTSQDAVGNSSPISTSAPTFIALTGSGNGAFYTDSGCTVPVSGGVNIAANSSSQTFYFQDTIPEGLTFNAASPPLAAGTLTIN